MSGNRTGKTEQSLSLLRALLTNRQVPDANRISITVGEVRALTGLRYTDWTSGEPVEREWPEAGPLDPSTLGMAMDMVDEDDAVLGVVGRGTKAERVAERYAQLMRLTHA